MNIYFILATFAALIAGVAADAYCEYNDGMCMSLGCDGYCRGQGRDGGQCGEGINSCTCYCEGSISNSNKVNSTQTDPCDCMYAGQCYSCGAQVNALVCFKGEGCGWRYCTNPQCIAAACSGRAC